jgi:hypothetical protein
VVNFLTISGLLSSLIFASCGLPVDEGKLMTDLGNGNALVRERFDDYRLRPGHCEANDPDATRILFTGFGLFTGASFNISGAVSDYLSDPDHWPKSANVRDEFIRGTSEGFRQRSLSRDDFGGTSRTRTLVLNGQKYEMCFLTLEVLWDLAGAIIHHEASLFKPEVIIMTGKGSAGAVFEGGAINHALPMGGYFYDGRYAGPLNTPIDSYVIPDHPRDQVMPMNWPARDLWSESRGWIESMGHSSQWLADARPSNDYICNNVSYVVLTALTQEPIRLAGGEIELPPFTEFDAATTVGFFHYPATASLENAHQWAAVMAQVIAGSATSR